jgi:NAD(P)-dependent dehydrogenase (short-subunit alcohol dehydrogenase family)
MANDLLKGKHAVIYGASGRIGPAVARTFVQEGAIVHLVARNEEPLKALAAELGTHADYAVFDAGDEQRVTEHLQSLPQLDISFNLVRRGDVHGQSLIEMPIDDLMSPIEGQRAIFLTAQAAARRMVADGGGVILWLNSASGPAAGPGMGGTGPADAAMDNFMRQLARDHGSSGLRTCGIWTAGVGMDEVMSKYSALGRAPSYQEVADAAAFLASDRAKATTGSILNVTAGVVF